MYRTVTIHTRSTFWTHNETNEVYSVVDADDLGKEVEIQCNQLAGQGYVVVSINPISCLPHWDTLKIFFNNSV